SPLAGALQAGDAAQAGGFPRAGVAEQGGDAAAGQLQIDVQSEVGVVQAKARVNPVVVFRPAHPRHPCRIRLPYSTSSTRKENSSMPPASQCAWAYSMASTWS